MDADGSGVDPEVVAGVPSPDLVVAALGRVLSSAAFARSERSCAFLSYVVSESLAGRGERISERTVGRAALGRGPEFDGLGDASVRVTATRVRQALQRYYAGAGASDPLRISLPAGRYAPTFETSAPRPDEEPLRTGVAVLTPEPGDGPADRGLAASVADALVTRLSGFEGVTVIGPTSARGDLADEGRRLRVSHVLGGRVSSHEGRLQLSAHLVSSDDGSVVWVRSHEEPPDGLAAGQVSDRWAVEVAAQVADHCGVVLGEAMRRGRPDAGTDLELAGRLAYYTYLDQSTKESIEAAVVALDRAIADGSRSPAVFAMRGAVANSAVQQRVGDIEGGTDLAERMARQALALDAGNAHAYLVLGGAARARNRWTQCVQYAEQAERLAPGQPTLVVGAGLLMEAAGEWAAGMELVERAFELNPRLPVNIHVWLAMGHVVLGSYDRALGEATLVDIDGEIYGPLYRGLALSGLGDLGDAAVELARVEALDPAFMDDIAGHFTRQLNLTDEQVGRLVDLVERARSA